MNRVEEMQSKTSTAMTATMTAMRKDSEVDAKEGRDSLA